MLPNIEYKNVDTLSPYQSNARTHSKKQITQIAHSIKAFGFNNPILIDQDARVVAGHGRLLAAKELGLAEVPTICLSHMTPVELKAYILADNKLAEKAGWDHDLLRIELESILELETGFDLTISGFETPELDLILNPDAPKSVAEDLPALGTVLQRVKSGDLWQLGQHRLYCGNSLQSESFAALLGEERADLVFTDPPYNVPVDGHVCGNGQVKHDEFAYAAGEMSSAQFASFLSQAFNLLAKYSRSGSIHYICMDWRHIGELTAAGQGAYAELKNVCVWNKQVGGMGSLYRSQHELVFVYKNGPEPHVNNIELGKHGRNRTNIWDYPGVGTAHRNDLKLHPTVKPVQLIRDAILDCSKQGDIILDCFGGSGSTLLAAEKTKRCARLIELEPGYCDVILHRYEQLTGKQAVRLSEVSDGQ